MQSINPQLPLFPGGNEQMFNQQQQQQAPNNQMFSPQINQARLINQQQPNQVLPAGMNLMNMNPGANNNNINPNKNNNQNMLNSLVMKQKLQVLQQQQQQQSQNIQAQAQAQALSQAQAQQPLNINNNNQNMPPGMNVLQRSIPSMIMNGQQQQQQQPAELLHMNVGTPSNAHVNINNANLNLNRADISNANSVPSNINNYRNNLLPPPNHLFIRDVWNGNLHSEFSNLRNLIQHYNRVSISTEFAGTLARPIGNFRSKTDYHYQTMRSNVDFLNPIQIGISICDANGKKPDNGPSSWQFNFKFSIEDEIVSADSLDLLKKSGINFENHKNNGIEVFEFAQLLMDSGLVLEKNVTWIAFHAAYDFGFLIHLLMNDMMPNNTKDFEWKVNKYLPNFYDLNLIYKIIDDFKEQLKLSQQPQQQQQQPQQQNQLSLTSLAEELGIPRFPIFTTTGGNSLLTSLVFSQLSNMSMKKLPNGLEFSHYKNLIFGILNDS
ncbi:hypothetical protein TPHA_0M02150 [Tetrapisispora phaffii CBS 4417]|uniref:poly(A)-specific ribonuclease n=1 Tax=Tetrapisispora phaffii (strain ATCC 24235 / CBS 4417 / NBRC 1672 / NRRL Y-8282 / UCD 70-5) TaxID=1071381 RepID=G8C0S4_TETPH|nr:hypothetical protein TPHA_0M02150 [Tetrapisispora phaffii CBS 4417]CCE65789.1 hypothetical protein TPHA_0M02150 [Tetrapisispora phaffii CBS 4417]